MTAPRRAIPELLFYVPLLVVTVLYFGFPDNSLRPALPLLVPLPSGAYVLIQAVAGKGKTLLNPAGLRLFGLYLLIGLFGLLLAQDADYFAWRKLLLPATALMIGLFPYRVTDRGFAGFLCALFILAFVFAERDAAFEQLDILDTRAAYESIFSIAFGAAAAWFIGRGRPFLALLSFCATVVLFKRNAIFAAAACGCVGLTLLVISRPYRKNAVLILAGIVGMAAFVAAFHMVTLLELTAAWLDAGRSATEISAGRTLIYSAIATTGEAGNVVGFWLGHGPGAVEHVVIEEPLLDDAIFMAHNEYLSLSFDFGVPGAILVLTAFFALGRATLPGAMLVLYLAIVFAVENILFISLVCMIIVFLLSARPVARKRVGSTIENHLPSYAR